MLANDPKLRTTLYVVSIVLAAISVVLAVGVIFLGWFPQEQVFAALALAVAFYQAFMGAVAKANVNQ